MPRWLTVPRAFAAAATAVVAALAFGASQGGAVSCVTYNGQTICSPPPSGYTGYGYGYTGGGGTTTPPPVHFTQKPDSSTTSTSATFNWEPDYPPPSGTHYNYDCKLDGTRVYDSGSSFECHPPKSLSVAVGDHTFSVAIVGAHNVDGPTTTYHWTVTSPSSGGSDNGGGGSTGTTPTPTGSGAPTGTPPPVADTIPPNVTLTFGGKVLNDLQKLLAAGFLPVTVHCSEPCTIEVSAYIDSATAKKLGLISRQIAIGSGKATLARPGDATVRVKLTKKARARLRRANKILITLKAVVRDSSGNQRITTKKVTLKRKKKH